ncbi:MAG: GNAT family N-acetyltransferase [Defluviitaleaceae bacterium]|nr:GNAT family N-acetyltransferase [Defluviitaleaceae bacterium]
MEHKIQLLEREKWQNHEAYFSDYADSCYCMEISHADGSFLVEMRKTPLESRKIIKYPQRLFASEDSTVKAWGVVDGGQLVAGIETSIEAGAKSPRLYVSLLWVDEKYRRQGLAAALVDKAKQRAAAENLRAVYLQTWSCNEHAIAFYLSQGFRLIGFDSCPFSNEDAEKFNVPLKLGFFL